MVPKVREWHNATDKASTLSFFGRDHVAGGLDFFAADEAFARIHGDRADDVVAQVLRNLDVNLDKARSEILKELDPNFSSQNEEEEEFEGEEEMEGEEMEDVVQVEADCSRTSLWLDGFTQGPLTQQTASLVVK